MSDHVDDQEPLMYEPTRAGQVALLALLDGPMHAVVVRPDVRAPLEGAGLIVVADKTMELTDQGKVVAERLALTITFEAWKATRGRFMRVIEQHLDDPRGLVAPVRVDSLTEQFTDDDLALFTERLDELRDLFALAQGWSTR